MLYYSKLPKVRVVVDGRVVTDRGDGYHTLLACDGQEMSLQEAVRVGIPLGRLVGVDARSAAALADLAGDGDGLAGQLSAIDGVSADRADAIVAHIAGTAPGDVTADMLVEVDGVGPTTAHKILAALNA